MRLVIGSLIIFSIVILFLFTLFPSDISVTRVIQINKPNAEVKKKIADLREWNSWNLFYQLGSNKTINYGGGNIDSNYIHEANVHIDLLKVTPDSVCTIWQHNGKSFRGNFILTDLHGQTVVEWTLRFHIKWYPWDKLASMFYDKELGPLMERSLIQLRNEVEKV